jgi:hypothetical protein
MVDAQHHVSGPWEQTDVARVVRALRRSGPRPLGDLARDPDLADWPPERVEDAVVGAWSHNLISIDPRDLLVAL